MLDCMIKDDVFERYYMFNFVADRAGYRDALIDLHV